MDLSKLSTEELMRMRSAAAAPKPVDLSKLSDQDLMTLKATAPEAPYAMVRVGRGVADVTEGVQQGAMKLRDLTQSGVGSMMRYVPGVGPILKLADLVAGDQGEAAFTKEKTEDIARYEAGRTAAAGGKDPGMDWARLGGNVAATLPVAMIPGANAATMGPRVASGALQGATAAAANFTPEGQSKAFQITLGAGIGALAPVVVKGIQNGYQRAVESMLGTSPGQLSVQTIEQQLASNLQRSGVDWNKLTTDVRGSLVADAQKALNAGGTLDDQALANKAVIESVGAKPTQAMVTRAPKDWQTEKNLRGVTGVGEPLAERDAANARAMVDYLGKLRTQTGGRAATAEDAGSSVISAVKTLDDAKGTNIDAAYGRARDHLGRAAPMNAPEFATNANLALDESMLGTSLPDNVRGLLNDVATGKIPFNVNTAVQLDRVMSAAQRKAGSGTPESLAIGKVRTALNSAGIGDDVGVAAKEAFDAARGLAKQRFVDREAAPAIQAAVDDVAPDKFVQKFILGADSRDLRALKAELLKGADGQQALQDVKSHILDSLLLRASNSSSIDDVAFKAANNNLTFSGQVFGKALDGIPPEKLHILFTPDEIGALRTLQKASKLMTSDVPFSDVNYSKTTAALANILQKVGQTPLLGPLVSPLIGAGKIGSDWVKSAAERKAVAEALLGSAAQGGRKALPNPGTIGRVLPGAAGAALDDSGQGTNK